MSVQEWIKRYKSVGGAAGLVRVEVLVPSEDRAQILAMAAELRTACPFQLAAAYDDPAWRRRVWQKAKRGVDR